MPRRSGQRSREQVHELIKASFPEPAPSAESTTGLLGNLGALVAGALREESEAENDPVEGPIAAPAAAEVDVAVAAAAVVEAAPGPDDLALQPPASGIGMAVEQPLHAEPPAGEPKAEKGAPAAAQPAAQAAESPKVMPGSQGEKVGAEDDAAANFGVAGVWGMQEMGHYEEEAPGEEALQGGSSPRAPLFVAASGLLLVVIPSTCCYSRFWCTSKLLSIMRQRLLNCCAAAEEAAFVEAVNSVAPAKEEADESNVKDGDAAALVQPAAGELSAGG